VADDLFYFLCHLLGLAASNFAMSIEQVGCEVCLKLQKEYSAALRRFADAMEKRTESIANGNYAPDRQAIEAMSDAEWACSEARLVLERHESAAHPKTRSATK
jgi:hypothetical protein